MKRIINIGIAIKYTNLILLIFFLCIANIFGQDRYNAIQLTFDSAHESFATWSPDGKMIVYSYFASEDTLGKNGLWKISSDGNSMGQIYSGIAEHPKLSPDGKKIVFDADSGKSIKIIPSSGGIPTNFVPDSIIIKYGGSPCWSPDGSEIAFAGEESQSIYVANINEGKVRKIFKEENMMPIPACWSNDGKSIFIALKEKESTKSTIWEVAIDGKEKKQITKHHEGFYRHLSLSPDGLLLVYSAIVGRDLGLWIMSAKGGKSIQLVAQPGYYEGASWSPDGTRLAFHSSRSGNGDVWLMDIDIKEVRKELQILNE